VRTVLFDDKVCLDIRISGLTNIHGDISMSDFNDELDASGLNCPLPILRAKKAINKLESGQVLKIIATDPGSVKDFEAFCTQTGNELLESSEADGKFVFLIKKG